MLNLIGGSKGQKFSKLIGNDISSCAKISTGGRLGGGGPLLKTIVKAKKRKAKGRGIVANLNPGGKKIKLEVVGDL